MFQNYLKIAFRNLIKHKGYTAINIFGIAVGFACCLLIGLYVQHEISYDKYHKKHDRIFRLANLVEGASYGDGIAKVCGPWGPEAKKSIPEVEDVTRFVFFGQTLVEREDRRYYERGGFYSDSTLFRMFDWKLLSGQAVTSLNEPNSVVLNEDMAEKYFPNEDPVGKTISFDEVDMKITGVMENVPSNSHFIPRFIVSLNTYEHPDREDWTRWNQFYTYLMLTEGADPEIVAKKFDLVLAKHVDEETATASTPFLQPIGDIHLHSNLHREIGLTSNVSYIYIFSIIALFILIIASLNFINLSTARSAHRAKEVGVRKVTGASRWNLVKQFLSESAIVCVFAVVLAVMLAEFVLPYMNTLVFRQLELDLIDNKVLGIGLLLMTILMSVLSGSYPAFILSAFQPSRVLKGDFKIRDNAGLRKALVVFQFAIATFLIVAALVVTNQLDFIRSKNLGFNKEQIINVPMRSQETIQKAEAIKQELLKIPGVTMVSTSANQPGGSDYGVPYRAEGLEESEQPAMRCLVIDPDFLDTYEMELADGRNFSTDMPTDKEAYLINETAAKQLGWENPLNERLSMPAVGRESAPIIGIVKDFHFRSMHQKIAPLYFFWEPTWFSQFNIKLDAQRVDETLALLEQKWQDIEAQYPFAYTFFDQRFDALHAAEQSTASLIKWFTGLAIFITCLGLFGLSTYTVERRTKEIGIRKVLGASLFSILSLMSREIIILVSVSIIVAMPLAFLVSSNWLSNFAYSAGLGWWIFGVAAALAIGIALFTVSYHSIKAALLNPVDSLKYE